MSSLPWFKFSPSSWRGDQSLRAVSIAARGLWIECLCIMHEAKPYGHLVLNGKPVVDSVLANMTGVPVDEVSALMAELREAGVFSVNRKGVVFSRRMTRDHSRSQKGKKAADKRWGQDTDNIAENAEPNGLPNANPLPRVKSIEPKNKQPPPISEAKSAGGRDLFDEIWEAFPRNPSSVEAKAERAFRVLSAKDQSGLHAAVIRYRKWFAADCIRRERTEDAGLTYVPHLSTWIESGAWKEADSLPVSEDQPVVPMVRLHRENDADLWGACVEITGKVPPTDGLEWSFRAELVDEARQRVGQAA